MHFFFFFFEWENNNDNATVCKMTVCEGETPFSCVRKRKYVHI